MRYQNKFCSTKNEKIILLDLKFSGMVSMDPTQTTRSNPSSLMHTRIRTPTTPRLKLR
jgi:hypothetical protein